MPTWYPEMTEKDSAYLKELGWIAYPIEESFPNLKGMFFYDYYEARKLAKKLKHKGHVVMLSKRPAVLGKGFAYRIWTVVPEHAKPYQLLTS